jgi:hypothetical protein
MVVKTLKMHIKYKKMHILYNNDDKVSDVIFHAEMTKRLIPFKIKLHMKYIKHTPLKRKFWKIQMRRE